jgi:hypothetical protein
MGCATLTRLHKIAPTPPPFRRPLPLTPPPPARPQPPTPTPTPPTHPPKDDVLYEDLTVLETLRYAALLRLPQAMARADKDARVEEVIAGLGLRKSRGTIIGGRAAGRLGPAAGGAEAVSVVQLTLCRSPLHWLLRRLTCPCSRPHPRRLPAARHQRRRAQARVDRWARRPRGRGPGPPPPGANRPAAWLRFEAPPSVNALLPLFVLYLASPRSLHPRTRAADQPCCAHAGRAH